MNSLGISTFEDLYEHPVDMSIQKAQLKPMSTERSSITPTIPPL